MSRITALVASIALVSSVSMASATETVKAEGADAPVITVSTQSLPIGFSGLAPDLALFSVIIAGVVTAAATSGSH